MRDLVVKALICRESNAVAWQSDRDATRVRNDLSRDGITPEGILREVRQFVRDQGREVVFQVVERREGWREKRDYYKVILPVDCYKHGLFVEMVLSDDDPEVPCVDLVNAHEQTR